MPPASDQPPNSYDFFLNNQSAPKRQIINVNKYRKNSPLLLVIIGLVLIIVIIIISSVFLNKGNVSTGLVSLTEQQNELIRVAGEGASESAQQTTKNLAVNIEVSLSSDQRQLLNYLSKTGKTVSPAQLLLLKSSNTDQQLTNAEALGTYDSVFIQIIQKELTSYQKTIKQTYDSTSVKAEKQLLNNEYSSSNLLVQECSAAIAAL